MTEFCNDWSVRGRRWQVIEPKGSPSCNGIPDTVAAIAAGRGVVDLEEFFRPTFKGSMPDPFVLKDMERAVARFCDAVERDETVAVFGDYDVDGATSTGILVRYMRMLGREPLFYIPDRMKEGYGPNAPALIGLRSRGAGLVLVVDSGTVSFAPIAEARKAGLDVVVIDHHEQQTDELPDAVVVNPKRRDEDRSLGYLCTAGLAFLFAVAANRELRRRGFFAKAPGDNGVKEPDVRPLLGIVALGTVADVVPLVGLNRAYVKIGLPRLCETLGLRSLIAATKTEPPFTAAHCGFQLGPCINAGGRIGDPMLGSRLLTTESLPEAEEIARLLTRLNDERKEIEKACVRAAVEQVETRLANHPFLVVASEDWHPGVVGLVASRLKEKFDRPVIAIGSHGKGSARSVDGFDVGSVVIDACKTGLLAKGGGHTMAAGLTLKDGKLESFRDFACARTEGFVAPPVQIDMTAQPGGPEGAVVEAFEELAPFGAGNASPRVAVVGGVCVETRTMKEVHVKAVIADGTRKTDVVMFNGADAPLGKALLASHGKRVDAYGVMKVNEWNGRLRVDLRVEDAMIAA